MLDGDLTFQLHLELSVKYPLQQKFEEYISQDPFNSFDTGKNTHTHRYIYIYIPYAPKPYKFVGSMEKPRVSEGNPRFSKPILKYGFSTGMYGLNMGLVRVKHGFSTV